MFCWFWFDGFIVGHGARCRIGELKTEVRIDSKDRSDDFQDRSEVQPDEIMIVKTEVIII